MTSTVLQTDKQMFAITEPQTHVQTSSKRACLYFDSHTNQAWLRSMSVLILLTFAILVGHAACWTALPQGHVQVYAFSIQLLRKSQHMFSCKTHACPFGDANTYTLVLRSQTISLLVETQTHNTRRHMHVLVLFPELGINQQINAHGDEKTRCGLTVHWTTTKFVGNVW